MIRPLVGRHEPGLGLELTAPKAPAQADVLCLLDGRLDNAAELAAELGLAGPPPSPEDLLARAYRRWGRGVPARMRGDFVVLFWDRGARAGLLARDQLGVRPVYLHRAGRVLRFATEPAALLESLPRRPEPDPASVAHWISAGSRPGTATLYRGVDKLAPGTMVLLDRSGTRTVRYWEPRFEEPLAVPDAELAERVGAALQLAVRRRLDAASPTAVLLSGGLDSAAVAAVAAASGAELRACSGTFPEFPAADETELIAELRAELGLRGPVVEGRTGGLIASAEEHLEACGMPLASWGDFWTLPLLREAAAEGAAAVLGGDGGDELFGPRFNLIADELRGGHPRRALDLTSRLPGAGPSLGLKPRARLLAEQALLVLPSRSHGRLEALRERRRLPAWLRPGALRDLAETDDPVAWRALDGPRWWGEIAHGVARRFDEVGVFEGLARRAALAGMEARHPLLDLDLVELGLRQPPAATIDPRYTRPVLREAVAGAVPDRVRLRPEKARFESLVAGSLAGPELPRMRRLLLGPEAEIGAYVDRERLREELFEGRGPLAIGGFRWMWFCWRLTTAELWLRGEREGGKGASSATFFNLTMPPVLPKIHPL